MRPTASKKTALSGLFLALALIVSLLENLLPPVVPALPYAKLGLGNVILLMCFLLVGVGEGYCVLLLKCLLAAVFSGNFSSMLWSVPAALAAYTVMIILHRTRLFSTAALSVAGGMVHNAVQIAVGAGVAGSAVVAYLPYMIVAGGVAGLATGVACHFVLAVAERGNLTAKSNDVYVRIPRDAEGVGTPEPVQSQNATDGENGRAQSADSATVECLDGAGERQSGANGTEGKARKEEE